jgi:hypothetical protein
VEGRNILFDVAWDVDRGRYLVMEGKGGQVVDTTAGCVYLWLQPAWRRFQGMHLAYAYLQSRRFAW